MKSLLAFAMCLLSIAAQAQDMTPMPPASSAAVGAATIAGGPTMTWESFCQTLTEHQPAADVAYAPAVDVHGRAVVPADLPAAGGQALNLPKEYRLLITTNQAQQLNLAIPNAPMTADAFIGQVVVGEDGAVSFNGQPVRVNQVYAVCGTLPPRL